MSPPMSYELSAIGSSALERRTRRFRIDSCGAGLLRVTAAPALRPVTSSAPRKALGSGSLPCANPQWLLHPEDVAGLFREPNDNFRQLQDSSQIHPRPSDRN